MSIEVRLFATLRQYLPAGGSRIATRVDLPDGTAIADVLAALGIPDQEASLIVVDGRRQTDRQFALTDGNVVSIWPHVAGG